MSFDHATGLLRRATLEKQIQDAIENSYDTTSAVVMGVSNAGKTATCQALRQKEATDSNDPSLLLTLNADFFRDIDPTPDAVAARLLVRIFTGLLRSQSSAWTKAQLWLCFYVFAAAYGTSLSKWTPLLRWWKQITSIAFLIGMLALILVVSGFSLSSPPSFISLGVLFAAGMLFAKYQISRDKERVASTFRPSIIDRNAAAAEEYVACVTFFSRGLSTFLNRLEPNRARRLLVHIDFNFFSQVFQDSLFDVISDVRSVCKGRLEFVLISKFDLGRLSISENRVIARLLTDEEASQLALGLLTSKPKNTVAFRFLQTALATDKSDPADKQRFGLRTSRIIVFGPYDRGLTLAGAVKKRVETAVTFLDGQPDSQLVDRISQALLRDDENDINCILDQVFDIQDHGLVGLATVIDPCQKSQLKPQSKLKRFLDRYEWSEAFLESKRLLSIHRRHLDLVDRDEARSQFFHLRGSLGNLDDRHILSEAERPWVESRLGMMLDCLLVLAWDRFEMDWGDTNEFLDLVSLWISEETADAVGIATKSIRVTLFALTPPYGNARHDPGTYRWLEDHARLRDSLQNLLITALQKLRRSSLSSELTAELERLQDGPIRRFLSTDVRQFIDRYVDISRKEADNEPEAASVALSELHYKSLDGPALRARAESLLAILPHTTLQSDRVVKLRSLRKIMNRICSARHGNFSAENTEQAERYFLTCHSLRCEDPILNAAAISQPLLFVLYACSQEGEEKPPSQWLERVPKFSTDVHRLWRHVDADSRQRLLEQRQTLLGVDDIDPRIRDVLQTFADLQEGHARRHPVELVEAILDCSDASIVRKVTSVATTRAAVKTRSLTALGISYLQVLIEILESDAELPCSRSSYHVDWVLAHAMSLAALPSKDERGKTAKRAVRRYFFLRVFSRLANEQSQAIEGFELIRDTTCDDFCNALEENKLSFDQTLLAALAKATPLKPRTGDLIVAKVRLEHDNHSLDMQNGSIELECPTALLPTNCYNAAYKDPLDSIELGFEDARDGNRRSAWNGRLMAVNMLRDQRGSRVQVTARGREYVARLLSLLFPCPDGWRSIIDFPDHDLWESDEIRLWIGGSNSACVLGMNSIRTSLFLDGDFWRAVFVDMLGLNRFVVFTMLADKTQKEKEIRGFVNNMFRDLRIQFDNDGSVVAYDTSQNADGRKIRTFLQLFRKIYRRQIRVEGYDDVKVPFFDGASSDSTAAQADR